MNNRTIERLKQKFIGIAMLAMFLAMLFIGGTIFLSSMFVSHRAIRSSLDAMIASERNSSDISFDEYYIDDPRLTEIFTISVREQADYWLISYDTDGNMIMIDGRFAAESEDEIIRLCEEVKRGPTGYGQRGRIWYKYADTPEGQTLAFIDASAETNALRRLLLISLVVCLAGLAVTYILVVHFSEAAVAPEIENLEKQKDFITNASHELKTPLSVIRANTEMSQMINGEDEWSESTLKQIDHMNGLIANLVMISKAQEIEDKSEMAEIEVTQIVESVVKTFEPVAAKSELTLEKHIAMDVKMTADASKIMQLTTILLDNAIKYCDEKGSITVGLTPVRKGIRLTVSNTYKDGANTDYNKFFERFYREDKSHNIDKGGYGIGLSIAQNICRQYKGDIKAVWKNEEISFVCMLY